MEEKTRITPADAIHLATARRKGAKEFHTYDGDLLKLGSIVPFTICEPRTDRMAFEGGGMTGKKHRSAERLQRLSMWPLSLGCV